MDAGTEGGSDAPTQPIENWARSKVTEIMEREGEALVLSARGTAWKATEADRELLTTALIAALLEALVMGERAEKTVGWNRAVPMVGHRAGVLANPNALLTFQPPRNPCGPTSVFLGPAGRG